MTATVLLTLLLFSPNAVLAATMRCGSRLVEVGDTEYEVLKKCGPPAYKQHNQWIYDRGAGRFLKIVVFGNGRVLFIKDQMPFT
ncbi:MAG: DUF2845 domain-containing protein [Acidiferrobacterales bacterium]